MTDSRLPGPGWIAGATLILAVGFLGFAFAAARLAGGADAEARAALAIWTQVVLVKGLLPQLWLCLALWPVCDRLLGARARGRIGLALGLAVAAVLAGLPVAAWLLPLDLPRLPAVAFRGPANFAATVLEMSVPVWLAALLPGLVRHRREAGPSTAAAG